MNIPPNGAGGRSGLGALKHRFADYNVPYLFLPTVATNSGMWGQADSIYAVFGLSGVTENTGS